jgi:hypothetical protein
MTASPSFNSEGELDLSPLTRMTIESMADEKYAIPNRTHDLVDDEEIEEAEAEKQHKKCATLLVTKPSRIGGSHDARKWNMIVNQSGRSSEQSRARS